MEGNKQILIVDDDAEFAGMVAQAVRDVSSSYTVQVSTDARAATAEVRAAQAAARSYDLVITDIKMPGSSGLQLLKTLSEIAPETKTITMTAYHSPELASQAQHLNVHAYLIKPIALSEFRQVVRAALSSPEPDAEAGSPLGRLSATQRTAVERRLANLRATSSSTAALLVHTNGTILAIDSAQEEMEASALCKALIDAQRSIAQAARYALSTTAPIQQSSYSTATYGICTYRLDDLYVLVTVFGPTIREGHVWFQMRETAKEIAGALAGGDMAGTARRPDASEDWRSEIEQYFSEAPRGRVRDQRPGRAPRRAAMPRGGGDQESSGIEGESAPPSPEQIGTDVSVRTSRDPIAAAAVETPQAPALDGEQERGLDTEQPLVSSGTDNIERPSLDEINWEVSADLDWEEIVTGADQGFAGVDFHEAKRLGLIDDLETS